MNILSTVGKVTIRRGLSHHLLGHRFVYQTVRCIYRLADQPYSVDSVFALFSGYRPGSVNASIPYDELRRIEL